jgi:creatinine amidohydrolase/Fe(II)-dependent formamide hydrolase-like protein
VYWGSLRRGEIAAARASSQSLRVASVSYWNLAPGAVRVNASGGGGTIGHAGEAETSIALHLRPDHVDVTALQPDPGVDLPVPRQAFAELVHELRADLLAG